MLSDDPFWQAIWAFAWRIGLTLFVLYNIPRIIRGTRIIWAEIRVYPPFTWWRALPAGFGWGIAVSGFAFLDPIIKLHDGKHQDSWSWVEIAIFMTYVWGSVGILHAYRAADRWFQRRKKLDVSFLD